MKASFFYNEKTESVHVFRIVLMVFLLAAFIGSLSWVFQMASRPARTVAEVSERTFDGDNVIYQYEHFFDQHEAILSTARKVRDAQGAFDRLVAGLSDDSNTWSYTDKQRYEAMSTALFGLRNILSDQCAAYNADAAKINRQIFMSDNLPHEVDADAMLASLATP